MANELDKKEAEQYRWVQKAHLEVLKTELIFKDIIVPMHEARLH